MKTKLQIITTLQTEKSELELKITAVKENRKQDRKILKQVKDEKLQYMEKLLKAKEELSELKKMKEVSES